MLSAAPWVQLTDTAQPGLEVGIGIEYDERLTSALSSSMREVCFISVQSGVHQALPAIRNGPPPTRRKSELAEGVGAVRCRWCNKPVRGRVIQPEEKGTACTQHLEHADRVFPKGSPVGPRRG